MNVKRNLVTQEELETLQKINDDCIRMHVCPPPVTFVDMEVKDAEGSLVDGFTMKSNSWVRNAYNVMVQTFGFDLADGNKYGEGGLFCKSTSGANKTYTTTATFPVGGPTMFLGGAGVVTHGIVVGGSDSAEGFEHYALTNLIGQGAISGTLSYQAGTRGTPAYNSTTKKWTNTISRIMNNNSGGAIIVKEVGQYVYLGNSADNFEMFSRDVLTTPVTVPNGGQLTVTYTIEMTFPA